MSNTFSRAWSQAGRALMIGAALTMAAGAAHAQTQPLNDDFEDAQPFRAANGGYLTTGYWYGNTAAASDQDDEPTHAGNYGGKSVWFYWVAPYSGTVTFTTAGSRFDTLLAAYRGNSLENLVRVVSNDDASQSDSTSAIRFNAAAGSGYFLAVDGFNDARNEDEADPRDAESGYYRLNVSMDSSGGGTSGSRPANDFFSQPYNLGSSTQRTLRGSNLYATRESYEPNHAGRVGGRSVWFTWAAPYTGYVQLSTGGSTFQTLLAAYYGNSLQALRVYGSGVGSARFYAVRGYTYRIALDGLNGASGTYVLNLTQDSTSTYNSIGVAQPPSIVRTSTSTASGNVRRRILVD